MECDLVPEENQDLEEVVINSDALLEEREGEHLRDNQANHAEHGNTAVLDLSLLEPLDVNVIRQAKRIEADVARKGAVQALRLRQERN